MATQARSAHLSWAVLFWLGFIAILGPMAIDIYLPALPQMAKSSTLSLPEVIRSIAW